MILSWLNSRFGDVILASNDTEARIDCPFCNDSHKHLYVNIDNPKAHCFKCEWSGNWLDLIIQTSDVTYAEAMYILENSKPRISRYTTIAKHAVRKFPIKPERFRSLVGGPKSDWNLEMIACWNYLMRRIKPEIVDYRFGSIPDTNRVWFLVDDGYWTGRALANFEPRYLNPNAKKNNVLWNWECLAPGANITLTEGIFGALAVGPFGVALLGKSITMEQARRIAESEPRQVNIMLDKGCWHESLEVEKVLRYAGADCPMFYCMLEYPQPTDSLEHMVVEHKWYTTMFMEWKYGSA